MALSRAPKSENHHHFAISRAPTLNRPCAAGRNNAERSSLSRHSNLSPSVAPDCSGLVTFSWVVMAIGFVGWSVYAIVRVPSKSSRPQSNKLRLADDVDAWNRGFLSWVSLSWADGLMGRCALRSKGGSRWITVGGVACLRLPAKWLGELTFACMLEPRAQDQCHRLGSRAHRSTITTPTLSVRPGSVE